MQNINFSTASVQELEAAGFTVTQKRSQLTKRNRKSLFGVRPSINNARHGAPVKATNGTEAGDKIRN